jgi:hypothetical protein
LGCLIRCESARAKAGIVPPLRHTLRDAEYTQQHVVLHELPTNLRECNTASVRSARLLDRATVIHADTRPNAALRA